MSAKKPSSKNWRAREIIDWTAVTFYEYMKEIHQQKFNAPYIVNNIKAQNACIKRVYEEFGKEVTKEFIDLCFSTYKPRNGYKGVNFMFCYSFLRERYLPQAISTIENRKKKDEYKDFYNKKRNIIF